MYFIVLQFELSNCLTFHMKQVTPFIMIRLFTLLSKTFTDQLWLPSSLWSVSLTCVCPPLFFSPGLSTRSRWFPSSTMLSSQWCQAPWSVLWMASHIQWPRQPMLSQVPGQRNSPGGGACTKGLRRDSLLHWIFGYVHQWLVPSKCWPLILFFWRALVSLSSFCVVLHGNSAVTFSRVYS